MEDLKAKLFRLLKDEIYDLSIGRSYNKDRIKLMRDICHILTYFKYVDVSNSDLVKIIKFYD